MAIFRHFGLFQLRMVKFGILYIFWALTTLDITILQEIPKNDLAYFFETWNFNVLILVFVLFQAFCSPYAETQMTFEEYNEMLSIVLLIHPVVVVAAVASVTVVVEGRAVLTVGIVDICLGPPIFRGPKIFYVSEIGILDNFKGS